MWAKVAIADMTTRSIAQREGRSSSGKTKGAGGSGGGGKVKSSPRKSKKSRRGKRKQQGEVIGEVDGDGNGVTALREVCVRSCRKQAESPNSKASNETE